MKASKSQPTRRAWSDKIAEPAIALGSKWLRTRQAALYLNLSYRTLAKLRSSDGGPTYRKVGGTVLFRMDEHDAWVDSHSFTSTSEEIQVGKESRNA
ncbi:MULTISPECIES: helix-turn-helix transcriptional regulator [Hyphomicrobiales]|uniref:helix-turn-helix transcriptional regulator n=1 Tax=Xanthobacter autotrophicus TaxID=280 RepID=UPI0037274275